MRKANRCSGCGNRIETAREPVDPVCGPCQGPPWREMWLAFGVWATLVIGSALVYRNFSN